MGKTNLNSKSLTFSLLALLIAIGCTTTDNHLSSGKKPAKLEVKKISLLPLNKCLMRLGSLKGIFLGAVMAVSILDQ